MPFESKSQQKYMYAKHPEIAKRFSKEMKKEGKSYKNLPEKKQKESPWMKVK